MRYLIYIVNCRVRKIVVPYSLRGRGDACHYTTYVREAVRSAISVETIYRAAIVLFFVVSFGFSFARANAAVQSVAVSGSNSALALAQTDPSALVRNASQNELANSYGHRLPMRYRLRKITAKSDTTKEIVETRDGAVARLIAVDGHALGPARAQQEAQRLHSVSSDPAIEAHRRSSERRDAQRINEIMRLLPDAFIYRYAGKIDTPDGSAIHLTFGPNPKFSPPDLTTRVLTGIRGDIWIDADDLRVVRIDGHIFKTVDYGWGLLGTVNPGGTVLLERTKTSECGWQLTRLSIHLHGRALLFKTLHISIEETATDYHRVSSSWTYQDAVRWLLGVFPKLAQ